MRCECAAGCEISNKAGREWRHLLYAHFIRSVLHGREKILRAAPIALRGSARIHEPRRQPLVLGIHLAEKHRHRMVIQEQTVAASSLDLVAGDPIPIRRLHQHQQCKQREEDGAHLLDPYFFANPLQRGPLMSNVLPIVPGDSVLQFEGLWRCGCCLLCWEEAEGQRGITLLFGAAAPPLYALQALNNAVLEGGHLQNILQHPHPTFSINGSLKKKEFLESILGLPSLLDQVHHWPFLLLQLLLVPEAVSCAIL